MSYWTFRRSRAPYWDNGFRYTEENFKMFSQLTGRNGNTIHSIGGMSSDLLAGQAADMARAVAKYRGMGASLYEWSGTSSRAWSERRRWPGEIAHSGVNLVRSGGRPNRPARVSDPGAPIVPAFLDTRRSPKAAPSRARRIQESPHGQPTHPHPPQGL